MTKKKKKHNPVKDTRIDAKKHKHYGRVKNKKKKKQAAKQHAQAKKTLFTLSNATTYTAPMFVAAVTTGLLSNHVCSLLNILTVAGVGAAAARMLHRRGRYSLTPAESAVQELLATRIRAGPVNTLIFADRAPHLERVPPILFGPALGSVLAASLRTLDLSRNTLRALPPEIGSLAVLAELDVSRNFLKALPSALGRLAGLMTLDVSSNVLRPGDRTSGGPDPLCLGVLAALPALRVLDLRHNNKLGTEAHFEAVAAAFAGTGGRVDVRLTRRKPKLEQIHAADRDATALRSQLAPHATGVLRRRLALVFGETTDPARVPREEVVVRLLRHYETAGMLATVAPPPAGVAASGVGGSGGGMTGKRTGRAAVDGEPWRADRRVRRVVGAAVAPALCEALLAELEAWATADEHRTTPRERPTIRAQHYMIISNEAAFPGAPGSRSSMSTSSSSKESTKAAHAAAKLEKHASLWTAARQALESVDPDFARRYTAVAFTKNFEGSPHIDTQNTGPFYGLALGDFHAAQPPPRETGAGGGSGGKDGDGGGAASGGQCGADGSGDGGVPGALCVECSAREVAHVDTRGRLAKVPVSAGAGAGTGGGAGAGICTATPGCVVSARSPHSAPSYAATIAHCTS